MANRASDVRKMSLKGVPQRREIVRGGTSVSNPQRNRNTFNRISANSAVVGQGRPLPSLPTIGSVRIQNPAIDRKRQRVDGLVMAGNSAKRKVDIGGTSQARLRRLGQTALGTNMRAPNIYASRPTLTQFQRGLDGLPAAANFNRKPDPFTRGQAPTRPRGAGGIAWGGMPQKPSVFDLNNSRGTAAGLAGTGSNNFFIDLGENGATNIRRGIPSPFTSYPYQKAAAGIQNNSKTGKPNALVKFTHTLTPQAAAYATATQKANIWMIPIMIPKNPEETRAGILGANGPDPEQQGFNLSVANYLMALDQPYPNDVDDIKDTYDMLARWKVGGVIAAEYGEELSPYTTTGGSNVHRMVVIAMQGETESFNYWGDVKYGNDVGLILKGVSIRDIFAHNYRDYGSYNLNSANANSIKVLDSATLSNNPLQFVPWYDNTGQSIAPSDDELMYYDDFGAKRRGVYIKVGKVIQVNYPVRDQSITSRTFVSANATIHAGKIRILVTAHHG